MKNVSVKINVGKCVFARESSTHKNWHNATHLWVPTQCLGNSVVQHVDNALCNVRLISQTWRQAKEVAP